MNSLGNNHLLKEKCKEQRSSKQGCPYYNYSKIYNSKFELYPLKTQEAKIDLVQLKMDNTLGKQIVDIEDIHTYFQQKKVCAYFSTKENSKYADVG